MSRSLFGPLLALPSVLLFLGLIATLIVVIVKRRRLGRAAFFAIAGVSIILVETLLSIVLPMLTGVVVDAADGGIESFYAVTIASNTIQMVLWAAGFALIILAVFAGRPPQGPAQAPPSPGAPPP